jgi:predicted nuclease of predicted toxin-antitoxin system
MANSRTGDFLATNRPSCMKFLGDMGISPRTIALLRERGYDAIHLVEQKLERMPDPSILEKARQEGRILLTVDLDFTQLLAISGESLPSVILFRLGNVSREVVNTYLLSVLENYATELESGSIISVNEASIRLRRLPL